jgi:hypothetical protein
MMHQSKDIEDAQSMDVDEGVEESAHVIMRMGHPGRGPWPQKATKKARSHHHRNRNQKQIRAGGSLNLTGLRKQVMSAAFESN